MVYIKVGPKVAWRTLCDFKANGAFQDDQHTSRMYTLKSSQYIFFKKQEESK